MRKEREEEEGEMIDILPTHIFFLSTHEV